MPGFLDFLSGGVGEALGGLFGGGIDAAVSAKMAADNRRFQERMTRHRYQYQMQDMQAAGLNPMLSFMQSPSSAPGGAMPSMQSPVASGIHTAAQLAQIRKTNNEADMVAAQTVKAKLEAKAYGVPSSAWDWTADQLEQQWQQFEKDIGRGWQGTKDDFMRIINRFQSGGHIWSGQSGQDLEHGTRGFQRRENK